MIFTGRRAARRAASLLLLVALAAASCSPDANEVPPPDAAADEFLQAWTAADQQAMAALLADSGDSGWSAERIGKLLERQSDAGAITGVTAVRSGLGDPPTPIVVNEPDPGEETPAQVRGSVPFSITYESTASAQPATLTGILPMSYEIRGGTWKVVWDKSLLWPGVEGAQSFDTRYRWPRRAEIVDRGGRVLARGTAESRRYPYGAVGGTTMGHIAPLSRKEARELRGESAADDTAPALVPEAGTLVGASGLEAAFNDQLAGLPSGKLVVVDGEQDIVEMLGRTPAEPGRRLKTTLDIEIQRRTESAFGTTVGGAVVIDPRTGDLRAIVSSSPFDPNNYVGVEEIDPFNRALSGLYPPGSAMKVVTASAALETKTVTPSTRLSGPKDYKGVRNFESQSYSELSFADAVKFSVNSAFAQVAEDLGARPLRRYADAFGFNRAPKMALDAATSSFPELEDLGDLMFAAIGQAQVLATPLQMATVAATVANGGRRMEPRIDSDAARSGARAVSRRTAATMTELMQGVVEGGTGQNARISGVAVAGKSGTAEVDVDGKRKNHAWFICFAGTNRKVAVAVVAEYGGVGGVVAAPIARNILVGVLPLL